MLLTPVATAAADDYTPDDQPYTLYASSTTVTVGAAFSVLTTGPDGGVFLTVEGAAAADGDVEIAGVTTELIEVDADGTVTSVTFPAAGTYRLYVTDSDGKVISNVTTLTAVAASSGGAGMLPVTGGSGLPYLVLAGALLLAGATVLVVAGVRARSRAS